MGTYRVFVTRHFIDVCFFDIEAPTKRKARNAAEKAANTLRNQAQSRAVATDNTWIPNDGVNIERIGYPNPKSYGMKLFSVPTIKDKTIKIYHEKGI